jgi:hypothetical protein
VEPTSLVDPPVSEVPLCNGLLNRCICALAAERLPGMWDANLATFFEVIPLPNPRSLDYLNSIFSDVTTGPCVLRAS